MEFLPVDALADPVDPVDPAVDVVDADDAGTSRASGEPPRSSIARCTVTEEVFVKVMGRPPERVSRDSRLGDESNWPATNVSWAEAAAFCARLTSLEAERSAGRRYRLPATEEWAWLHQSRPDGSDEPCFEYSSRPLHWSVWEWCAGPGGDADTRLWWSHPDPFVGVNTFRVACDHAGR